MDEALVRSINEHVAPNDQLFILGDVSFAKPDRTEYLLREMNGIKTLIWGNHDSVIRDNAHLRGLFDQTHELLEQSFTVDGQKIKVVMCHFAMRVWNQSHRGALHLYGHSHNSLPDNGTRSMDVGVDAIGMRPISLEEVVERIGSRIIPAVDHHNPKEAR